MQSLEDMSLGHRIALTFVIVLIILFALAAYGFFSGAWDQAEGAPQPKLQSAIKDQPATTYDARIFALDRDALDEAYKDYIKNLFVVWMKSGDAPAPERAVVGANNARRAYLRV